MNTTVFPTSEKHTAEAVSFYSISNVATRINTPTLQIINNKPG